MQESIVFFLRVQRRSKESSRSLSHLLMSFLLITATRQYYGIAESISETEFTGRFNLVSYGSSVAFWPAPGLGRTCGLGFGLALNMPGLGLAFGCPERPWPWP